MSKDAETQSKSSVDTPPQPQLGSIPETLRCLYCEEYSSENKTSTNNTRNSSNSSTSTSSSKLSYTCQVTEKPLLFLHHKEQHVLLSVEYASLTYADALVVLGKSGGARAYPIIPGSDFVGRIISINKDSNIDSNNWEDFQDFQIGDRVIAHGGELGRAIHGGFSTMCSAPMSTLTRLPDNITTKHACMLGSAAITAMLAVIEIEKFHRTVKGKKHVLISGASGSIGGMALIMLARLGYTCTALTRDVEGNRHYLSKLGASKSLSCTEFLETCEEDSALATETYIGVVDTLGGGFLSKMLPRMYRSGIAVSCGCVGGDKINVSLIPFIRRGIRLVGIDSRYLTPKEKYQVWKRLSHDDTGSIKHLLFQNENQDKWSDMFSTISLNQVQAAATKKLNGRCSSLSVTVDVQAT